MICIIGDMHVQVEAECNIHGKGYDLTGRLILSWSSSGDLKQGIIVLLIRRCNTLGKLLQVQRLCWYNSIANILVSIHLLVEMKDVENTHGLEVTNKITVCNFKYRTAKKRMLQNFKSMKLKNMVSKKIHAHSTRNEKIFMI